MKARWCERCEIAWAPKRNRCPRCKVKCPVIDDVLDRLAGTHRPAPGKLVNRPLAPGQLHPAWPEWRWDGEMFRRS